MDKSKVTKIIDKSGASADLLDLYSSDGSHRVDIYKDHWALAEHMNFFIPACARSAHTVSIGDKKTTTNLKSQMTDGEYESGMTEEWLNDVCHYITKYVHML